LDGSPVRRPSVAPHVSGVLVPSTAGPTPRRALHHPAPRRAQPAVRRTPDILLPVALGASVAAFVALGSVTHAALRGNWAFHHARSHAQGPWWGDRFPHPSPPAQFVLPRSRAVGPGPWMKTAP